MAVDDALNGGQSYSGAFKLLGQMQTLKDAEQLVDILHVKAGAVVLHEQFDFIFIAVDSANLDFGRRALLTATAPRKGKGSCVSLRDCWVRRLRR